MDIASIIFDLLGNFLNPENINKLVEQGAINSLIEKADKETIYAVCITILAYQVQDPSVRKKAIEMLGQIYKNIELTE